MIQVTLLPLCASHVMPREPGGMHWGMGDQVIHGEQLL